MVNSMVSSSNLRLVTWVCRNRPLLGLRLDRGGHGSSDFPLSFFAQIAAIQAHEDRGVGDCFRGLNEQDLERLTSFVDFGDHFGVGSSKGRALGKELRHLLSQFR